MLNFAQRSALCKKSRFKTEGNQWYSISWSVIHDQSYPRRIQNSILKNGILWHHRVDDLHRQERQDQSLGQSQFIIKCTISRSHIKYSITIWITIIDDCQSSQHDWRECRSHVWIKHPFSRISHQQRNILKIVFLSSFRLIWTILPWRKVIGWRLYAFHWRIIPSRRCNIGVNINSIKITIPIEKCLQSCPWYTITVQITW